MNWGYVIAALLIAIGALLGVIGYMEVKVTDLKDEVETLKTYIKKRDEESWF